MSIKNKIWRQADGTKIRLGQMTQQHLKNCVAMFERNARRACEEDVQACMSLPMQGEIASMHQDQFVENAHWHDYLPDIYWDMKQLIV